MKNRIIVFFSFALYATAFLPSCLNRCKEFEKKANRVERPVFLHYRVEAKYHDSTNDGKNAATYAMSGGLQYQPVETELWNVVNVGDSLIKDSGSLKYIIKHKEDNDTEILLVQCNGKVIK
jgi:hypothetical protein